MRFKKELYKKEQEELADKIIKILELKDNSITLYDIDNGTHKKQKIMDLIPEVRKYFNFSNIMGAREPEYLSRSKNFSDKKGGLCPLRGDTTSVGKKRLSTYRETV